MKRNLIRKIAGAVAALLLMSSLAAGAMAIEAFGTMPQYQKSVLTYCNKYRSLNKLPSLALDDILCALAEKLAYELKSPVQSTRPDGRPWQSILDEYGYTYEAGKAERNILRATTNQSAKELVESFMQNTSSKRNLLDKDFTHTGVFVRYSLDEQVYYFVQIFAKPVKQPTPTLTLATAETKINVRKGPGTSYSVIGALQNGEQVTILSYAGKWAKIKWADNSFAYVHADYLSFKGQTTDGNPPIVIDQPKMTNAKTKVAARYYAGPSAAYQKLGTIPKGYDILVDTAYYEGKTIQWFAIPYNGKTVFVHIDDVKLDVDISLRSIPVAVPKADPGDLGIAKATANVNVRTGPGTGYGKLGQLKKGDIVAAWALHGKWMEITFGNEAFHAYVHTDYLGLMED